MRPAPQTVQGFRFLAYLWGIETGKLPGRKGVLENVFSLPMRNWNIIGWATKGVLLWFLAYLWGIVTSLHFDARCWIRLFLAYLWGIETRPTTPPATAKPVFSLPMRNWNKERHHRAQLVEVFSLPMRNWNTSLVGLFRSISILFSLPMRNWNRKAEPQSCGCGFLPMRNWNLICLIVLMPCLNVFSLPMRNWTPRQSGPPGVFLFLAYLWGIETDSLANITLWRRF